ncbi:MAG TPA: DUF4097 family beta strand repeat-containing protein [Candidatus Acidoferrales bacterium]|nr:DUF4097 family beta strand repeat-containing protein [Candidatus Acidoferrales bacterium]
MSNGRPYRSSLFAGLLLILLGVIFLIDRNYPDFHIGHLVRLYWPLLLILWGVAKLLDHLSDRGAGPRRPGLLSGGEAILLVLIAIVLSSFVFRDWLRDRFPGMMFDLPAFHESFSQAMPPVQQTLQPGARVAIATGRGDVTVHPSDGDSLIVTATKSGPGASETSAREHMRDVAIAIEPQGNGVLIRPIHMDSTLALVSVDIDVRLPKSSSLSIDAAHGDVSVSGISGNIEVRSGNGDTDVHDAGADVSIESQNGDIHIGRIGGNLRLNGRGDDVDVQSVAGNVAIEGAFLGSIEMRDIAKNTRCATQFSAVTFGPLTGRMQMDSDDISLSGVSGDAKVITRNKDVAADRITGELDVVDSHSDINVTYAEPPRANINITDESGDVHMTLPSSSSFFLSAMSRSGEVNSDFGGSALQPANSEEMQQLSGQFGNGGPRISILNTYGTIQLTKSPR